MYDVYKKCTWKWSRWKERLFRIAVDVDVHGYIHVWISDLRHAGMDMYPRMCDISV